MMLMKECAVFGILRLIDKKKNYQSKLSKIICKYWKRILKKANSNMLKFYERV